ncbi:hypothetical protein B9Z19DRAFT_1126837 [Tuber borchii]|uniref:Uncharacterized protein n=1 Tax=Tuber borchii TaxID=42251 RepID=A0A2T6ZSD8_TUBBO|nr:hypothetical protein B9Z19DRAFT_1126837 [Tuber borchii]
MLLEKVEDLSFKDEAMRATIIHDAVDTGVVEILRMVLYAGASIHIMNLETGRFPIHHAFERGSFEMTSLLARKAAGCNMKEAMSVNTLLHIVFVSGYVHPEQDSTRDRDVDKRKCNASSGATGRKPLLGGAFGGSFGGGGASSAPLEHSMKPRECPIG